MNAPLTNWPNEINIMTTVTLHARQTLLTPGDAFGCPFCGEQPAIEPWHGGGPDKKFISCGNEQCEVAPQVSGETRSLALAAWNTRSLPEMNRTLLP